jgi:AraC-like DNA-binding protein
MEMFDRTPTPLRTPDSRSLPDLTSMVLGQAAGDYCERAPIRFLRPHFACAWVNQIPFDRSCTLAIPPDGCIDLQWVNGALRIAGPDRGPKFECLPPGSTVLGLRFQAGSAGRWLNVSASEIVNQRLPLEIFWGLEARHIGDWVSEAPTLEGKARRLQLAIARKATMLDEAPDAIACQIFRLVDANRQPGTETLELLRNRLRMSERALRRKCLVAFGYGPKMLDRVLRFQRFLRASRAGEAAALASLASETGFSDQAHLSRETRRMAGLTPGTVLTQLTG